MSSEAVKNYIKHPSTPTGEVFKIATDYAHSALITLSDTKVLDAELRHDVQNFLDEKLSGEQHKPFRQLIDLFYRQGRKMEDIAKLMNVSIPQIYDWRSEALLVLSEMYLPQIMIEKFKCEIINILKFDPEMVAAVSESNNLVPASKRGRPSKV